MDHRNFSSLYDSYSGITNNPSESINAVLKRMTNWQEFPVDSVYYVEIQQGRAGLGNYQLKSKFKEARLDKDEIWITHKIVAPDEIIQYEKSSITDVDAKPSSSHALTTPVPSLDEHEDSKNTADDLALSTDTDESDNTSLSSPVPLPEETMSTSHKNRHKSKIHAQIRVCTSMTTKAWHTYPNVKHI